MARAVRAIVVGFGELGAIAHRFPQVVGNMHLNKRLILAVRALALRQWMQIATGGAHPLVLEHLGINLRRHRKDKARRHILREERGIKHLLIDQPSVDKEEDGGALAAHKAFWNIPKNPELHATITELIFVPDEVEDGLYLLNLQVAPMENDAAPSRPVLFQLFA